MTAVLINRRTLDTKRDTHRDDTMREDEGRDWGDALISQGTPKSTSSPARARKEAWGLFFLIALEGINAAYTLILDY